MLLLLICAAVITALFFLTPEYYDMTSIGIVKIPFFILGAWAGKQAIEDKQISIIWFVIMALLLAVLYIHPICPWLNDRESLFRLVGLALCCTILYCTERFCGIHALLRWVGEYTLELYILHLMIYDALPIGLANSNVKSIIAVGGAFLLCTPVHKICARIVSIK